jgi:prevent-host-death family protein
MGKKISVAEAKATFSDYVREVEAGSSLIITKHGKPVAALVRSTDLEHLERLRKQIHKADWPELRAAGKTPKNWQTFWTDLLAAGNVKFPNWFPDGGLSF